MHIFRQVNRLGIGVITALVLVAIALLCGICAALGFTPFAQHVSEKGMDDALAAVLEKGNAPLHFEVVKVIDGDTFVLKVGSGEATIRVLGINTPETVDPRKPVQCYGHEASARAHALLDGQQVSLVLDHTESPFDKYGRVLAYAALPNGASYNEEMIKEGYAFEYTYAKPYERQGIFRQAQAAAQAAAAGLWASSTCSGKLVSERPA